MANRRFKIGARVVLPNPDRPGYAVPGVVKGYREDDGQLPRGNVIVNFPMEPYISRINFVYWEDDLMLLKDFLRRG